MEKIAQIPNIAGVKESSGDISQMNEIIREISLKRKEKFWVLSGDDYITLPLISIGGDGAISVISNLVPAKVKALTKFALEGKYEEARRIHYELIPFMKAAFVETNPVPIKQALGWAGLPAGPTRPPLGKLTPASEAVLKKAVQDLGFKV
jgi:4-hydroxy-tetrahydrodipicolinate synthase